MEKDRLMGRVTWWAMLRMVRNTKNCVKEGLAQSLEGGLGQGF